MGEAFWRFSLVLYSRPSVAEALLRLQDRDGCNINLILFGLWCGVVLRHELGAAELAEAEGVAAAAQEVAVEVRKLRRCLKPAAEATLQGLRRRCAMLELAAERVVQKRLADAAAPPSVAADGLAAAAANLALYLGPDRARCAEATFLREALAALVSR